MNEFKISKIKNKKCLDKIIVELNKLLNFYLPECKESEKIDQIKKNIHKKMIYLSKKDRKLFGSFFDASQCLPSLHALNEALVSDMKKLYGFSNLQIADYPRLRLDLPEKNSLHNDPWHQEVMAYDAPRDSVTVWLPIVKMSSKLGRLVLKGNTKKIGILKHKVFNKRPYIRVKPGNWQNLPNCKPNISYGNFISFKHSVPHRSSKNLSKNKVRISIQIRYNFLDNSIYNPYNYKPTTSKVQLSQDTNLDKIRKFKF